MAFIHRHGSFVFFTYVCAACLVGLFSTVDVGFSAFWRNLFTVLFEVQVGAGVTVLVIDRFNEYRATESLKRRLIREAGSRSHDIAISAVEWMDREGWLQGENGLLKGAHLREAQLNDARLQGANLERTDLRVANLCGAKLGKANLEHANLVSAKAKSAVLNEAMLERASLNSADLEGAYLKYALFDYATLRSAKIRSANLDHASFRHARMLNVDLTNSVTSRTNFFHANMHKAKLRSVTDRNSDNFEGATLTCVDLVGADFEDGHLKGADLRMADLRNTNLIGTNLQGANLYGALLEGADIWPYDGMARLHHGNGEDGGGSKYTEFWQRGTQLSSAVLPDGTVFSDDMDYDVIAKFTDREHSEFKLTLAALNAIRDAEINRIDWEMMLGELDGL